MKEYVTRGEHVSSRFRVTWVSPLQHTEGAIISGIAIVRCVENTEDNIVKDMRAEDKQHNKTLFKG